MNQTAPFSFKSVPRAGRSALQWRLLLLWVLLMLVPTAIVALPVWQTLSDNFDQSVHVAALAQQLDLTVVADLLSAHGKSATAFSNAGLVALIVTLLLSPLLSGMAITAARSAQVAGFGALWSGALAEYPRMLRMLLWAVVPLGIAIAIGGAAREAADKAQSVAVVASDAQLASYLATAVMLLLFAVAHATLDAGRAALAIERRRTSAIKAWWSGCKMLIKRPLATLGVYLIISLLGLGLVALLAVARLNVPGGSVVAFIGALVLTQVIVAVVAWMRSARLFAMMDVARSMAKV